MFSCGGFEGLQLKSLEPLTKKGVRPYTPEASLCTMADDINRALPIVRNILL